MGGRKMKRIPLLVLALAAAATVVLASAPAAHADDTNCATSLVNVQVEGNVIVPEGQTCVIFLSEIRGNVIVRRGAALTFRQSTVLGNIEGDGFRDIFVDFSTVILGDGVLGNVIAKNGSNPGRLRVINSSLEGNVQFESSAGELNITNSSVGGLDGGGSIQVAKNETTGSMLINGNRASDIQFYENEVRNYAIVNNFDVRGSVQVYKNVHAFASGAVNNTGQSVQCFDNTPALFVGGPNPGAAKAEGQCFR
jgi:hypothetical protein